MKMPLNEFEQHIDEDILKRGLQYFKKGYVNYVDELSGGEFDAEVEGSETYTVHITVKNGEITDNECTCPYDWGPMCKHQVAVLFYMQQEELGIVAKSKRKSVGAVTLIHKKLPAKKKTVTEQVDEVLDKLSVNDLKNYIRQCCDKDKSFCDLFLARHLSLTEKSSKAMFAKQIGVLVNVASRSNGYIDWDSARTLSSRVGEIGLLGERELVQGNYSTAMYIGMAILEEMTKAMDYGDDSNGDFGTCIDQACTLLCSVAEQPLPEMLRKELLNYCLDTYSKKVFKGWDWHYVIIQLAVQLFEGDVEKQLVNDVLDAVKSVDGSWNYEYEQALRMRLEIIRKTESDEKVQAFLCANTKNTEFRKELINRAIDSLDYAEAIRLSKDGIECDKMDKPGLVDDWQGYLLQIYQKQNDVPNIIQQARYLFIHAWNMRSKDNYDIIKKYVPANEWKDFFDQLVVDKSKSHRGNDFSSISNMYIWEEQWENLFLLLQKRCTLDTISSVESYLAKDYAPQLVVLYQDQVLSYLVRNVSRDHYKVACKYIRRMIKLGGRQVADALILQLKKLYPQRRALMEELGRV